MPYPNTIGGGLMGYPTTVDSGGVIPIAAYDGEFSDNGSVTYPQANLVILTSLWLPNGFVGANAISTDFTTGGNGHYDLGLFDSSGANNDPGTLLAHCASSSTALATATGRVTPTFLNGAITLSPGNYWLAIVVDNTTDHIVRHTNLASTIGPVRQYSGAVPLATVGTLSNSGSTKPLLTLLRQNSWS